MSSNFLVVLSGPSGAGKSTLVKMVLDAYDDFAYSVSATTREPREGEQESQDYFFVTRDRFQDMIANDELIEWAEVFGQFYYGTPRQFIRQTLERSNVIIDVDVQGGLQIMESVPEALFVFVQVEDLEVLEKRIRGRADIDEEELRARLETARTELECRSRYDFVVTNHVLDDAFRQLKEIIDSRKAS